MLRHGTAHASHGVLPILTRIVAAARRHWTRVGWLEVIPLARYSPDLNPRKREWRMLKRDDRSHLAASLRDFVDEVSDWWMAGHRRESTGRPPGQPIGAKKAPRRLRATNVPAPTWFWRALYLSLPRNSPDASQHRGLL